MHARTLKWAGAVFVFLALGAPSASKASEFCDDGVSLACVIQHAVESANSKGRIQPDLGLDEWLLPSLYKHYFRDLGILITRAGMSADAVEPPNYAARDGLDDGIALVLLEQGQFEVVLELLHEPGRDSVRPEVIERLLADGRLDEAIEITQHADPFGPRQEMLTSIARSLADAGRLEEARFRLADEVRRIGRGFSTLDLPDPICHLLTTFDELPPVEGNKKPTTMVSVQRASEDENPQAKLKNTVACLSTVGRFHEAIAAASLLEDQEARLDQLADIADDMRNSGDLDGAWSVMAMLPEKHGAMYSRYSQLALAYIEAGQLARAEEVIAAAEATSARLPAQALGRLAKAYSDGGDDETAMIHARKIQKEIEKELKGFSPGQAWFDLEDLHPVLDLVGRDKVETYLDTAVTRLLDGNKVRRFDLMNAVDVLPLYGRFEQALDLIMTYAKEEQRLGALIELGLVMLDANQGSRELDAN